MEGYIWKRRHYKDQKKNVGDFTQKYCAYDADSNSLVFRLKKEDEESKSCSLNDITEIYPYQKHGMLLIFRKTKDLGIAFLFMIEEDGVFEGMNQEQTRDAWFKCIKPNMCSANNTLEFVSCRSENIYGKYDPLEFARKHLLGSGMCGDVRRVKRRSDEKYFAMKTIKLSSLSEEGKASLWQEINILKSLDHPHIAKLHESFIEPNLSCKLVLEVCDGGELFRRRKAKGHFCERYSGKLMATMLKAMNYLHSNLIVHRDLKLENWLFWKEYSDDDPEDADLALVDFGLSRRLSSPNEEMERSVGTPYYVAPEVIEGHYRGTSCDMWSMGVIAYMLLSGEVPFGGSNDVEITNAVRAEPVPDLYNEGGVWAEISRECKDFVLGLLDKNPSKRMTAREALQHPWIESILEGDLAKEGQEEHKVDNSVLQRLRNFAQYNELKRLAMEAIAFSLDHNEIRDLTALFEKIDTDHDGYIKLEELVVALKDYDNMDRKDVEEIFSALDEEHNGKIHVNEFVAATLHAKYHMEEEFLKVAFQKLDFGNKRKIKLSDLQRVLKHCASPDRVLSIWEQSGISDNGEISVEEFFRFMRSDGEKNVAEYRRASATPDMTKMNEISRVERLNLRGNPRKGSGGSRTSLLSSLSRRFKPMSRVRRIVGRGKHRKISGSEE